MNTVIGKVYPTSAVPKTFYGLPKIHNVGPTLRPIIYSSSSITHRVAKELAKIICPLVDQSPHHLKKPQHLVQHVQKVKLEPGEVMTSFDVKALFTSVHVDLTLIWSNTHYSRTLHYPNGPTCPYNKSSQYRSSASKTYPSSSTTTITNRSMV